MSYAFFAWPLCKNNSPHCIAPEAYSAARKRCQDGATSKRGDKMRTTMKGLIAVAAVLMLAACSESSHKTASFTTTTYEQMNWTEMTAASSAAQVTNNNLIMMR